MFCVCRSHSQNGDLLFQSLYLLLASSVFDLEIGGCGIEIHLSSHHQASQPIFLCTPFLKLKWQKYPFFFLGQCLLYILNAIPSHRPPSLSHHLIPPLYLTSFITMQTFCNISCVEQNSFLDSHIPPQQTHFSLPLSPSTVSTCLSPVSSSTAQIHPQFLPLKYLLPGLLMNSMLSSSLCISLPKCCYSGCLQY